jgi:hypothetical protein
MESAGAEKLQTTVFYLLFFIPIIVSLVYWAWQRYKTRENQEKCPNCGELWAAVHLHEKFMGGFIKRYDPPIRMKGRRYLARFEKYQVSCKCKYCGHEWEFYKSEKQ